MWNGFLHGKKKPFIEQWQKVIPVAGILASIVFLTVLYVLHYSIHSSQIEKVFEAVSVAPIGETSFEKSVQRVVPAAFRPELPPPPPPTPKPQLVGELPSPSAFAAGSIIVKDHTTGLTLYRKNEYEERPIASITKLMSALVLLEQRFNWTTSTQVVADTGLADTHMYAGDTYTLQELWDAMLIGSSNKAVMTLVDALGWSREAFVARMNEKAIELGMGQTHFADPTGLDPGNSSTASDVVILLSEALKVEIIAESLMKKDLDLYSKERQKPHHMWSTNWLLLGWVPHEFTIFRGGKTGYIPASGYNFSMQVSDDSEQLLDVVVLGTGSHEERFTVARDAAMAVYDAYEWTTSTIR